MNFFKNILKKIKKPKIWFTIICGIVTIVFFGATVAFALLNINQSVTLTFLSLFAFLGAYFVYCMVYYYPSIKAWFIKVFSKNRYTKRYIEDFRLRGLVSACISFVINTLYAIAQGVLAILSQSVWYGALSIYYIVLSSIRGGILIKHFMRRKIENKQNYSINQAKSYRNCGIYLNLLTLALSGAIVQMVLHNQGYKYAGIMIYVMAFYAFYKIIVSIVNPVKAKKNKDLTIQSIRNINLADALVSMLALQTAMFHAFGGDFD